jgi:hypothetical protein
MGRLNALQTSEERMGIGPFCIERAINPDVVVFTFFLSSDKFSGHSWIFTTTIFTTPSTIGTEKPLVPKILFIETCIFILFHVIYLPTIDLFANVILSWYILQEAF